MQMFSPFPYTRTRLVRIPAAHRRSQPYSLHFRRFFAHKSALIQCGEVYSWICALLI